MVILNQEITNAAARHGNWIAMGGLAQDTNQHGLCRTPDSQRWFNTLKDAWFTKGDLIGAVHPNEKGYNAYPDRIEARLLDILL